ncbi:MAG: hypothetical protein U0Y82_03970 [Thermoleophilia bacterium]
MRARGLAAAAAAAVALGAPAGALAAGGAASAAFERWDEVSGAVITGDTVVALVAATNQVKATSTDGRTGVAFTYFSADAETVRLTPGRRRFRRTGFDTALTVRTSIGSMVGGRVLGDAAGHMLVVPGTTGFPPPVVWCCDANRDEVVLESDGSPTAPVVIAAGFDEGRVRLVRLEPGGGISLISSSPQNLPDPDALDVTRTSAPFGGSPSGGLVALADGVVAWAENPATGVLRVGTPTDAGVSNVGDVQMGGAIQRVWAAPGLVVALVRTGAGLRVMRLVPGRTSPVAVWRGRAEPRVAVGGGAVAVAAGRMVLASRSGSVARVALARGDVAAVAVDGNRVVWFQRMLRRSKRTFTRWTVARVGVVRK